MSFNLADGVKAARKLLKTYVDVATSDTPEWFLLGSGVEDSAIELNPTSEAVRDILGVTNTTVTGWDPVQSFDPFTVKGGSKLAEKLHEIWINKTPELLSQFKVLVVYSYVGDESAGYDAELQKNCTINITSIGGSANVDMPIEISYSNDSVRGTVTFTDGQPTFEPAVSAEE